MPARSPTDFYRVLSLSLTNTYYNSAFRRFCGPGTIAPQDPATPPYDRGLCCGWKGGGKAKTHRVRGRLLMVVFLGASVQDLRKAIKKLTEAARRARQAEWDSFIKQQV